MATAKRVIMASRTSSKKGENHQIKNDSAQECETDLFKAEVRLNHAERCLSNQTTPRQEKPTGAIYPL